MTVHASAQDGPSRRPVSRSCCPRSAVRCDGACARWPGWPWKRSPSTRSPRTAGWWPAPRRAEWPNCSGSTPALRRGAASLTRAGPGRLGTGEGTGRTVRLVGVRTGHSRRPHGASGQARLSQRPAAPSLDRRTSESRHVAAAGAGKNRVRTGQMGRHRRMALSRMASARADRARAPAGSALGTVPANRPPDRHARSPSPPCKSPAKQMLDLDGGVA